MATLRFGEIEVTIAKGNAYDDFLIDSGGNFGLIAIILVHWKRVKWNDLANHFVRIGELKTACIGYWTAFWRRRQSYT